jgi:hypothetical protein
MGRRSANVASRCRLSAVPVHDETMRKPNVTVCDAPSFSDELLRTLARLGLGTEEHGEAWVVMPVSELSARLGRSGAATKSALTRACNGAGHRCGWEWRDDSALAYVHRDEATRWAQTPSDIEVRPSALGMVRACAAEILAAIALWHRHPDKTAVVTGGRRRAIDVEMDMGPDSPPLTVDAKHLTVTNTSERRQGAGQFKMTRNGHKEFDESLTYVGAVFDYGMPVSVTVSENQLTFTVDTSNVDTRLLDAVYLNHEVLERSVPNARVVWLPDSLLGIDGED